MLTGNLERCTSLLLLLHRKFRLLLKIKNIHENEISGVAIQWAIKMAEFGAGEILLTSMDRDGTKVGFDLELTRAVSDAINIPVIASGGVGGLQDLADGIKHGHADAVLAASIFHYGQHTVQEAKQFMAAQGIPMRLA